MEITWNGFRLVHLGDADEKNEVIALLKEKPDVMVVPSWYLSNEGIELLNKVKAAKILVSHISPGNKTMKKSDMLHAEQILFKNYGDKINISK